MSAVVGIDISGTRLAWAVFDYENEIAECEMYRLTAARQADLIKDGLRDARRVAPEPEFIGIEQPPIGLPKAADMHGMAGARCEDACRSIWRHAPVRFFQPSEWRRIAGVGGRATKDRVKEFVTDEFGFVPGSQDEADAACIAVAMWVEAFGE